MGKGSNHKRKGGEEGLRRAELRRQAGSVRPTSVPPFLSPVAKWNPLLAPRFSSSSLLPFFGGPIVVHKSMHLVPPAFLTGFAPSFPVFLFGPGPLPSPPRIPPRFLCPIWGANRREGAALLSLLRRHRGQNGRRGQNGEGGRGIGGEKGETWRRRRAREGDRGGEGGGIGDAVEAAGEKEPKTPAYRWRTFSH